MDRGVMAELTLRCPGEYGRNDVLDEPPPERGVHELHPRTLPPGKPPPYTDPPRELAVSSGSEKASAASASAALALLDGLTERDFERSLRICIIWRCDPARLDAIATASTAAAARVAALVS